MPPTIAGVACAHTEIVKQSAMRTQYMVRPLINTRNDHFCYKLHYCYIMLNFNTAFWKHVLVQALTRACVVVPGPLAGAGRSPVNRRARTSSIGDDSGRRPLSSEEGAGCSATIWMRVRVASRRNAPELIVRCLTPMFPTLTLAQRRVPAPDRA